MLFTASHSFKYKSPQKELMSDKPVIKILGMGGTIASIKTDKGFVPMLDPKTLMQYIPVISDYCELRCQEIMNIDSSNLQPNDWLNLTKEVIKAVNDPEITGVICTHGTDTLSFSASAVALLTRNLGKPVVFTGSQIPLPVFGTDAERNLIDAIRVASNSDIAESVICFNSVVYRGCRTVKLREFDLSAFETVNSTPIAEIGRRIDIIDPYVKKRTNSKAWYDGPINPNVALIRAFPGMSPDLLRKLPEVGYEGVIIEGFGSGNLPIQERSLLPPIQELVDKNIPVVITTQCIFGRTELLLYETGRIYSDLGVISGYDMISEVALIKLMWALAKTRDLDEVTALMHTNLAGEINPLIRT